jgi:hypothetical protein
MNRRTVISTLCVAPFANGSTSTIAERKKFVGVWKLVSGESS